MPNAVQSVDVVVPTWQAAKHIEGLVLALQQQTLKPQSIVVIDSSSSDGTAQIAQRLGCVVKVIPQSEFNHGGTRNLGAAQGTAQAVVFMTQDALPVNERFLQNLLEPIKTGTAHAAFARQIPYQGASPLEGFARSFNYPANSYVHSASDIAAKGIRAYFFSDAASAVHREVFKQVGCFPTHLIMGEDSYLCAKLLHGGYKVAYAAQAQVWHSHHYTLAQQFRRYFDIGVFHQQASEVLIGAKTGGEGLRFVLKQTQTLVAQKAFGPALYGLLEAAAKWGALQLGKNHRRLPLQLKKKLSMHPGFWS